MKQHRPVITVPTLTFTSTAVEVERSSMTARVCLVRHLHHDHLGGWTCCAAIESTVGSILAEQWGRPGAWMSIVDPTVIESLARGVTLALHGESDTYGNPAAELWAAYLDRWLADDPTGNRPAHDIQWANAEQATTDHGVALAAAAGVPFRDPEYRWYLYSSLYRSIMRDPNLGGLPNALLRPALAWFTDVTEPGPVARAAEAAHALARLHPLRLGSSVARLTTAGLRAQLGRPVRHRLPPTRPTKSKASRRRRSHA
jgi:hypothetical protein